MTHIRPQGRLTRQWHGHLVEVSEQGLAIDGRTVDPAPLTERDAVTPSQDPRTHPALQFLPSGAVVYRGRIQVEVQPDTVTVHGPSGAVWPPHPTEPPAPAPGAGPAYEIEDEEIDL